jgi:hypothetical protein
MTATSAGGLAFAQNDTDPQTYTQMPGPIAGITGGTMQIIDVNMDGTDDVLVSNRIVLQCPAPAPPGTFTQVVPINATAPAQLVDLNNDGKPDLIRIVGNVLKVRIQQ